MSDDSKNFWDGYRGNAPGPQTDSSAYQYGKLSRLNEQERARRGGTPGIDAAEAGQAMKGAAILAMLAVAGLLLWGLRLVALSLAGAILTTALLLYAGFAVLGARIDAARALRSAGIAFGLSLFVAILVGVAAWQVALAGGPDLAPGIAPLIADGREPDPLGIAFPLIAGLVAGTWWLNRTLPPTRFAPPLRWAALALVLIVCPVAGAWEARAVLGLF